MDKVLEILGSQPVVSIICTTVVILALIYILRKQIVDYVKKKYGLYSTEEVIKFMHKAVKCSQSNKAINFETLIDDSKIDK